jgi:hypothetical protein
VSRQLLTLLEPAFTDGDPLVRLRAVEVIGNARPPEFKKILERFVDDRDPLVVMVVRAMLDQRTQPAR